jgi:hypothetical protein
VQEEEKEEEEEQEGRRSRSRGRRSKNLLKSRSSERGGLWAGEEEEEKEGRKVLPLISTAVSEVDSSTRRKSHWSTTSIRFACL